MLTIGLACHAAIEHEAFEEIWESLGEKGAQARRFISRVGKHPGTPHVELQDGSLYPVYFGWKRGWRPSSMDMINILYRLYTPPRCLTCFDALSEYADITVGDPWMAPPDDTVDFREGWSYGLIRSARAGELVAAMTEAGKLVVKDLTRAEALRCNRLMAGEKRRRAFRMIETLKRQGRAVPVYGDADMEFPHLSGLEFIRTEVNMLTHLGCFLPRVRRPLLRFFLGRGGYVLLRLNHYRRCLRFALRDKKEKLRRRWAGRR